MKQGWHVPVKPVETPFASNPLAKLVAACEEGLAYAA